MADIACRFVQQLKEKENQHSSAPNGVSEDQRSLRESTAEDTKSQIADALAIYMQQVQKSLGSIFTKGSHSTSNGRSDNQIDGNYEAIRSASHESPPVQRSLQESTAKAIKSQSVEALVTFVQ